MRKKRQLQVKLFHLFSIIFYLILLGRGNGFYHAVVAYAAAAAAALILKQVQVHSKSALIILSCSRTNFHLLKQRNSLSLRRRILRFTSWFGGKCSQPGKQPDGRGRSPLISKKIASATLLQLLISLLSISSQLLTLLCKSR